MAKYEVVNGVGIIPEGVKKIGKDAFYGCTSLTSVEIPEGVTEIEKCAFRNCTSLTNVVIPSSVTEIGEDSFFGCTSLTSVVIPEGVKKIGSLAFLSCTSLTSVVIPSSVTELEKSAFSGCTSLTSIVVAEGNSVYDSREGCNAIIESATNKLIKGSNSTIIPEGVTVIEENAFNGCTSLTSIVIPEGVTELGKYTFEGCTSLTSVVIPEGVTEIGKYTFKGCTSLTSVVIPKGVTKIGQSAFDGCSSLKSVVIPSSVKDIEFHAFCDCESLTSIEIPSSVTEIGCNAFMRCSSLTSIVVAEGNSVYDSREGCNAIIETATNKLIQGFNSTIIPEGVTKIRNSAFFRCTSLTNIVIPESVKVIGGYAFRGCTSLTDVVIPEGVTSIIEYTFEGCTSLMSVVIPESVRDIGEWAFRDCTSLTSIVIPEGVTSIVENTFNGCTSLTSIVTPSSVTEIGESAFKGCTSLKSIVINGKIKKIDWETFSGCTALESITLPTGVNKITWNAFEGCTSLKVINVPTKKYDYYYERIPYPFNSLIVEMEPVKKATKEPAKKATKEPAKKATSESTEKIKLSLHVGTAYRLCIIPMDDTICDICDEIFDDEVYNSPQNSICVYFYSYADGIKYSINNGRKKTLEDEESYIVIQSVCDYIDDEETSATTEQIIAEISEDNEDFSLIEKMNMASEIANPMSKEVYKDIKNLHNLRDDDERVDFIVDAIKRRMRELAEKLINDGMVGDVWEVDDVDDIHFALGFTQLDEATCTYMIDTNKFDIEKLRTIVCDDWHDCEVSNVLWNGSPDRLLSNIIYDGKFYEPCEIKTGRSYTETDIVDCNLQSLE